MIGELTSALIDACCPEEVSQEIREILENRASHGLPGIGSGKNRSHLIDRIQLATLKGSRWKVSRIRESIELANTDWRDLLVQKEFGEHVDAHILWLNSALESGEV